MSFASRMWARRLATATRPTFTKPTTPAFRPMRQWRGMASAASQTVDNIPVTTITEDSEANGECFFFLLISLSQDIMTHWFL